MVKFNHVETTSSDDENFSHKITQIVQSLIQLDYHSNSAYIKNVEDIVKNHCKFLLGPQYDHFIEKYANKVCEYLDIIDNNEKINPTNLRATDLEKLLQNDSVINNSEKNKQLIKARLHAAIDKIIKKHKQELNNALYMEYYNNRRNNYKKLKQINEALEFLKAREQQKLNLEQNAPIDRKSMELIEEYPKESKQIIQLLQTRLEEVNNQHNTENTINPEEPNIKIRDYLENKENHSLLTRSSNNSQSEQLPTSKELEYMFANILGTAKSSANISKDVIDSLIKIHDDGVFDYLKSKEAERLKMSLKDFYDYAATLYQDREKISAVASFMHKLFSCCATKEQENTIQLDAFQRSVHNAVKVNNNVLYESDSGSHINTRISINQERYSKEHLQALKIIVSRYPNLITDYKNNAEGLQSVLQDGGILLKQDNLTTFIETLNSLNQHSSRPKRFVKDYQTPREKLLVELSKRSLDIKRTSMDLSRENIQIV